MRDSLHQLARRFVPPWLKRSARLLLPVRMRSTGGRTMELPREVRGASHWEHLVDAMLDLPGGISDRGPVASVVVLTYNKIGYTRACIESIYRHTPLRCFELHVVDNASEDGTREYLQDLARVIPNLHIVLNEENTGFARGSNVGILRSRGDYVVLLNNDTIVTPGWLPKLVEHLEEQPNTAIVGPVTNSAGNEQMIPGGYADMEELRAFANRRSSAFEGRCFEIGMLGMFCVVFRRSLLDEIGLLDERYRLGTFEDDDFCHRARLAGYRLVCAEDVFIHHFGKGTMRRLGDRAYQRLFEENRERFERKWGVRWRPPPLGHP